MTQPTAQANNQNNRTGKSPAGVFLRRETDSWAGKSAQRQSLWRLTGLQVGAATSGVKWTGFYIWPTLSRCLLSKHTTEKQHFSPRGLEDNGSYHFSASLSSCRNIAKLLTKHIQTPASSGRMWNLAPDKHVKKHKSTDELPRLPQTDEQRQTSKPQKDHLGGRGWFKRSQRGCCTSSSKLKTEKSFIYFFSFPISTN